MRLGPIALPLVGLALGCGVVPRELSRSPSEARASVDELFTALAGRFGPAEREPRFASLRPKLARAGLVPSRVFDDATAWTGQDGPLREVWFFGEPRVPEGYRIGIAEQAALPSRPGDYRGRLRLERLHPGEFRWRMEETLALGSLTAEGLERATDALLRLPEGAPPGDAREVARASLPRTAAALGRLFSLDRLESREAPLGGSSLAVEATLHPEWLEPRLPRYASFLRGHVASMRMSLRVLDESGRAYWEVSLADSRFVLRLRLHEGTLAPLEGPPRRLGERCQARCAITMKQGLFRVGFEELQGEVALLRGPAQQGFRASFRKEPDWKLPFFAEPLLRGPLRRPFDDEGALLAYRFHGAPQSGAPSSVSRDYGLTVEESWIVRWLGGNVGAAVVDFRRGAEAEADRFTRDALLALRDDALGLLGDRPHESVVPGSAR